MKRLAAVVFFALALTPLAFADSIQLDHVQGDVQVQHKGKAWSPVLNGAHVDIGDMIKTGPKASVIVHFKKADVSLYENTEFAVNEYSAGAEDMKAELHLLSGHLQARVTQLTDMDKFEVVSPANVAAVRGTTLDLLAYILNTKNYTRLVTSKGMVKFCTKSGLLCVMVNKGEYATGDEDNIIGPKQEDEDEAESKSLAEEAEDQDGFDQEALHAQEDPSQFSPPLAPVDSDNGGGGGGGGGGGA